MADRVQQIHEEVRLNLEQANYKHKDVTNTKRRVKIFRESDLVMAHIQKNRFPVETFGKLKSQKYGMFRVKWKIIDNAYVVELPEGMSISNTFSVADLFTYYPNDPLYVDLNSRSSFSEVEETDVGQSEEAHRQDIYLATDNIQGRYSGVLWLNK
jgi:hypothetical protein